MDSYANRKYFIGAIIVLIGIVFIVKLFFLQVVDNTYKMTASNNVLRHITQYPARGLIYDRNGKLLVYNEAAYDLMVDPSRLKEFDTVEFCEILEIEREYVIQKLKEAKSYSRYKSSIFLKQVASKTYAQLQEKLYKFPGFFVQPRTLRKYTANSAAHILGYVGEVNEKTVENDLYYNSGDYIGISGVEKTYEHVLRGEKGVNIFLVDVHNRIKGSFNEGKYDSEAIMGSNIITTIDAELQKYGEQLMVNKKGSIVAIEPSTGEILALVSSPNYDPELLVGRKRTSNYRELANDTLKPLFNRAVMAQYPPGSTFKIVNALVGLQEGVVKPYTKYECHGGFSYGRGKVMGCHHHKSPTDLVGSIQVSCNTYYGNVYRDILTNSKYPSIREAFDVWKAHVESFGFGEVLNSDFPNELRGITPTKAYYDKYYGEGRWRWQMLISMSIGQGELLTTPLQMANMTATIANRGHYFTPHIVKEIEGVFDIEGRFREKNYTTIDSGYYETVIEGMEMAVNGEAGSGSTARTAQIPGLVVCGKTGTAQNPHGEDHSIFVAFAPKENPQIAISVYVENAGFGSTWGVPIARLMIEKYLNDSISVPWWEQYVLEGDLINQVSEKKD